MGQFLESKVLTKLFWFNNFSSYVLKEIIFYEIQPISEKGKVPLEKML